MRFKRLIPADYLQIRLGQRINLFVLNSKLKSNLKLQFVIPPFNFINIYTFLLLCLHSFDEGKTTRAPFNSTNIQQKEYIDFISDPVVCTLLLQAFRDLTGASFVSPTNKTFKTLWVPVMTSLLFTWPWLSLHLEYLGTLEPGSCRVDF